MRKTMKKTLSLLLAVCMMMGFVPVMGITARAADATVSYNNSISVSASKGTIESDVLTLPSAAAGYTSSDYAVTLTFANIYGSNNTVMVYGDDPDTLGFTIDPQGTSSSSGGVDFIDETIPASGSRTLIIMPKSGLSAGEYRYEFLILASGGVVDQPFTVSFTVTGDDSGSDSITVTTQPRASSVSTYGNISVILTAAGTASNSATVGYQWYSCADASKTNPSAISGAISASFTVPTTLDAGRYYYFCRLSATGCDPVDTNVAVKTVNKALYQGEKAKSISVKANEPTDDTVVALPALPAGASYPMSGTVGGTTPALIDSHAINNGNLCYATTSQAPGTSATITIPVTGATNYMDYSVLVTITATGGDEGDTTPDYTIVIRADGTVTKGFRNDAETFSAEGFSYNSSTDTLTLNNFEFSTTAVMALSLPEGGTIVFSGTNAFTAGETTDQNTDSYGIVSDADLTIKGTGSLTATAGVSPRRSIGIAVEDGTLKVEGGTVKGVAADCEDSAASVGISAYSTSVTGGKLIGESGTGFVSLALVSENPIADVTIVGRTGSTGNLVDLVHSSTETKSYGVNVDGTHTHAVYAEVTPKTATTPPGGGSTSATTTVPADTENKSTPVEISTSGNDVTLKLPDSKVEDIVKSADENVTFDLSKVKNAETAIIPVKAVETLSEGNVGITVKLPEAEITIAASDLTDLVEDAKPTENLRVEAEYISPSKLTAAQKEAVEGKRVIDINVFLGTRKVDVPVTVSVPYELADGEDPNGVCVWYMDDKGNLTKMTGSYDTKTGLFTFYTDHQSYYLIGYEEVETHLCDAFTDIKSHWGFDAICYMVENSVMNGTSSTSFEPNVNLSRAMMVQILYNLESKPAAGSAAFVDVASSAWYADAVAWASANGIVNGYGNDLFGPEDSITREQMVTILHNYAAFKGMDVSATNDLASFGDAGAVSAWALTSIQWAVEEAIISGKPGELIDPQGTATRAEIAQMMMNFMTK